MKNSIRSSTFKCISPYHNKDSPVINSVVFNFSHYELTFDYKASIYHAPIISHGTIVYKYAYKCDGNQECYDDSDESRCGINTFETLLIGKLVFELRYRVTTLKLVNPVSEIF